MTNDMHIDTCSLHTFVTTRFLMGGGGLSFNKNTKTNTATNTQR